MSIPTPSPADKLYDHLLMTDGLIKGIDLLSFEALGADPASNAVSGIVQALKRLSRESLQMAEDIDRKASS